MRVDQVRLLLRRACEKAGGQKQFAEKHHISPSYVNDVLMARREPGELICAALDVIRIVTYEELR